MFSVLNKVPPSFSNFLHYCFQKLFAATQTSVDRLSILHFAWLLLFDLGFGALEYSFWQVYMVVFRDASTRNQKLIISD